MYVLVLYIFIVIGSKRIIIRGQRSFSVVLFNHTPPLPQPEQAGCTDCYTQREERSERQAYRKEETNADARSPKILSGWSYDQNSWRTLEKGGRDVLRRE
jgi:hypothetical protein